MICNRCGRFSPDSELNCNHCGHKLQSRPREQACGAEESEQNSDCQQNWLNPLPRNAPSGLGKDIEAWAYGLGLAASAISLAWVDQIVWLYPLIALFALFLRLRKI